MKKLTLILAVCLSGCSSLWRIFEDPIVYKESGHLIQEVVVDVEKDMANAK